MQRFALLDQLEDVHVLIADAEVIKLQQACRQPREEITIVAHQQEGSFVVLQRFLQHVLALDVQVVCWFVKDQEVQWLQEHAAQGETRALSTAQHLHLLVHILTAEHERTEHGTHTQTVLFARCVLGGLHHGVLRWHAFGHILRVVTDDHVVPQADLAFVGLFVHDHPHQRGLTRSVGTNEREVFALRDGELGVAEDLLHLARTVLIRICLAHPFHLGHDLAAGWSWWELHQHLAQVLIVHLDPLQLIQLGDQALRERRFTRLRPELVDQVGGLLDVALLILRGGRLLFAFHLAQLHVLRPWHFAIDDLSTGHFQRALGEAIQERFIV